MKFIHKYFRYSCGQNPNKIEILLKKCKHTLSNNKLKEKKIYQLIAIIKKMKMIIRISFFFIYIVNSHIPRSTKNAITRCGYMLVLGNGRSQSKY